MLTVSLRSIVRQLSSSAPPTTLLPPERQFADCAIAELERILAGDTFLERVESATYSSAWWLKPDNTSVNLKGPEIAAIIRGGAEGGSPADGVIDLRITLTDLPPGTLAFTFPRRPKTRTDTDFFKSCLDQNDPGNLAAIWMHEWMHAAGFEHETLNGDEQDVAYTVQSLVRELSPKPQGSSVEHGLALPVKHVLPVAVEPVNATSAGPSAECYSVRWMCPVALKRRRRRSAA